ncbi:MAG: glycoside hydrolase family 88 protein [Candidatus Marinimicrobia bacterium]|nr:glycoside hydrolase family 88 protein [Candidatus Neomarinimicrobiota bacterium]MCF7827416.1 glycoside hydrolase family 88 protein [Candidatus Neomarinimicrobiota bacterium]MCF7881351.1 glycoside hydrolase family 88 protein [Candidatus Neomarinimicrobiota bacterium]
MEKLYSRIVRFFLGITLLFCVGSLFSPNNVNAQTDGRQPLDWAKDMVSSVDFRNPNGIAPYDWTYTTGTVLRAFEELWEFTGDSVYLEYTEGNFDNLVTSSGHINDYNMSDYNIDMIKNGSIMLFLYEETGKEKFKTAANTLREQLDGHPRTSDGGFWHKKRYPDQMWLDGLYMGAPFLARYAEMFNQPADFDDAAKQILLIEEHNKDPETGLYYHGWEEVHDTTDENELSPGRNQTWSDPETGQSPAFWGRAIGWFGMSLVDVLDYLPQDHENRDDVLRVLRNLTAAMADFQDEETGVWWQVVDQGDREGNYLESSVSSMMLYMMAKGIRKGYLDRDTWLPVTTKAYNGIIEEFIEENSDGTLDLTQTCITAGLGNGRSGTFEYYVYEEGIRANDPKALGPFINGCFEMHLLNNLPGPTNLNATPVSESEIELTWEDNSDEEDGFKIEQADSGEFSQIAQVSVDDESYQVGSLSSLTEYTFRVRAFKADTNSFYSNEATAMTLGENGAPAYASNPAPEDGAVSVDTTGTILRWEGGAATESHDVYFGATNPPPSVGNQTENSYDPGELVSETTYYWRIDEVNTNGTTEGHLWSLRTEAAPLPEVLTAHWSLDETSGTTMRDSADYSINGTLHNMSDDAWSNGAIGGGLQFDGQDDYVLVPHNDYINFGIGSFSVAFWLKQSVENEHMRYLIKGTHSDPGTGKRYEVFHHAENQVRFAIDDNSTKTSLQVSNDDFVTGNWVHVVAIRNTEKEQVYLYVNGTNVGYEQDVTGDISQNEDMYIGVSPDEDNTYLEATLDDIRLYNYALSKSQIQNLYSQVGVESNGDLPDRYKLAVSSYPNPFNPVTTIEYTIPEQSEINLSVYNLLGEKVRSLVNSVQVQGQYSYRFDAAGLSSGVYICRLRMNNEIRTTKLLLLK